MSLLIILPTYQRPDSLLYSISSVLRQKFNLPYVMKTLYIMSNDINSQIEVDNVVKMAEKQARDHEFDKIIVERLKNENKEQLGIVRIINIIKNHTEDGDVAILHGDDDIMLCGSLLDRYNRIMQDENCVSISKYFSGLNFIRGFDGVELSPILAHENKFFKNEKFRKSDLLNYGLPFISAYTYKINNNFWAVYEQALAWASDTPIKHNAKFLFMFFYIGLSALKNNQLSAANVYEVIRGRVLFRRKYLPPVVITHPDNPAIVNLTGLVVLNNNDLIVNRDLDDLRKVYSRHTSSLLWSCILVLNEITVPDIYTLLKKGGISVLLNSFSLINALKNIKILIEMIFNMSNIGLWIRGFSNPITSNTFWELWGDKFQADKLNQL